MARKSARLNNSRSDSTADLSNQVVFVYNDNVTPISADTLPSQQAVYLNSDVLGFPRNVEDPVFFDGLHEVVISSGGVGIVITSDSGPVMMETISRHKGVICPIIVKISGKENQEKALRTLFRRKGFKRYLKFTSWYEEIRLHRNNDCLIIDYVDIRGRNRQNKTITIRGVFV